MGRPNYSFEKRKKELKKAKKKEQKLARKAAKKGGPVVAPVQRSEPQPTTILPKVGED